jgi:hypothetical protein
MGRQQKRINAFNALTIDGNHVDVSMRNEITTCEVS